MRRGLGISFPRPPLRYLHRKVVVMVLVPAQGSMVVDEVVIKRSRFIATAARTDTVEQARSLIAQVRGEHSKARHHCSAFLIAEDGRNLVAQSSDDGEPSGTAGMPMLEVLHGSGLVNVTAVVTRYFGGILLGTGGLTRAYSGAVAQALTSLPCAQQVRLEHVVASITPLIAGRVESELRRLGLHIDSVEWGSTVNVRAACALEDIPRWESTLQTLTQGGATFKADGSVIVETPLP